MSGKKKILLVDDHSEIRRLFALGLAQSGYDTVEAATGCEAVVKARGTLPDLIVMDLAMPGGTGDEAIMSLKADPLTQDIPVIVLTALLGGPVVDRAIAAGAAEILHKPVSFQWLELVLQRHLSLQQKKIHHVVQ
jgi:CheY-like chemotaxis protein